MVVIPARWHSARFPGKPLVAIAGMTLLGRVIHQARRGLAGVTDARLVVATDDQRVADHANDHGCAVLMTSTSITSGSSRALAVVRASMIQPCHVVNLQGDAPFIEPDTIAAVVERLRTGTADCVTPVTRLDWTALDALRRHKAAAPFSGTTCVVADDGHALWFSKAIIPAIRNEQQLRGREALSPVHRHLGLYGYRLDALARFEASPPGRYEQLEGLEQLRLLELGLAIHTVTVPAPRIPLGGIDTPQDVAAAEALIERLGDPSA